MRQPTSSSRLLADIGGTNARFAWQTGPHAPIIDHVNLPCANYGTLKDAIQDYLKRTGKINPSLAVIAIANPVHGDHVQMTNHHWSFSIGQLQKDFALQRLEVINDFTALALALPTLAPSALKAIGPVPSKIVTDAPMGLIGPGTGLGVSGLLPNGAGRWIPLQSEGGHVTLPALTDRERLVAKGLAKKYGHASAERAISGQGMVDMFQILCVADQQPYSSPIVPADITQLAQQGQPQALESVGLFTAFLGTMAGNLALTLGARGGIYIGGGIVPKLGPLFNHGLFRQRFETKGRFASYLSAIPVWLITDEKSPALEGAAYVANQW